MLPGSVQYLFNCRVVTEGILEARPGYTPYGTGVGGPKLLHSIRRLNDPDESLAPSGYIYIVGNGTQLWAGVETALAEIDSGYSGNPLSILTFRPDVSPESLAYVFDANKQSKINAAGVVRAIGVVPPNAAPVAEYGIPAWVQIHDGQTATSWMPTGIDSINGTPQDRTGGDTDTIGFIIYDSGTTGWCCIQSSSTQPAWWGGRMQLILNPSGGNQETVVVREVIGGISYTYTISAIQYDSGTSGLASVVLSGGAGSAAVVRNQLLLFVGGGGNELVRVLAVVDSPDGAGYSIRVKLANTHAVGATVNSEQSWRIYTTQNHAGGETYQSKYVAFSHGAAGVGGGTYTFGSPLNAAVANGRTVDPANDYLHISFYIADIANVINLQILLSFDTTPNFSFTSPGNSFIFTVTQTQIIAAGITGLGWTDLVLPISSASQTGDITVLNLSNTSGIALQMTSTAACNWGFDWWYLFGTYGPVIQPNAPTGYVYDTTFRDSTTGAKSVPGPTTRYSLNPLREQVLVKPATTTAAGVDYCDINREGGTLTDFVYIGSVQNNNASPNVFGDGQSDQTIASNPGVDLTQLQPWPTLGLPLSGIVNVNGTSISLVSGNPFPTALVSNSVILLNGIAYQTYGQPHSGAFLELDLDGGAVTNATYSIPSPTLAGQPLPFAFGPLEGPFAPVAFALGDTVSGGTLYFSNTGNLDSASDQNTLELCGPTEPLVCGEVWNGLVFAGSRENIYLTRYSFTTLLGGTGASPFQWSRLPSPSGFWSRWTICRGPDGVYALGRDGIYRVADQGAMSITDAQLYPLFPHDGQPAIATNGYNPVDMTQINFMRLTAQDDEIRFTYLDVDANQIELRYEIQKKRWFPNYYANGTDQISLTYLNEGLVSSPNNLSILQLSRTLGNIYQIGGNDDNGQVITSQVQLPAFDGGDFRSQRLPTDWMVDSDQAGTIQATQWYNDNESTSPTLPCVTTGARAQTILDISSVPNTLALYRNISPKFVWTGGPAGPRLFGCEVDWYNMPFLSTRVLTQYINLSFSGWKSHRRLYSALISTSPVTFLIQCQDGRQFEVVIPSTNGQLLIQPQMIPQCAKSLAFAYQLDSGGIPFAFFPDEFVAEVKQWNEDSYVSLAMFKS